MASDPARHGINRAERVGEKGGKGPEGLWGLAERRKADRVADLTATRAAATAVSTPSTLGFLVYRCGSSLLFPKVV